MLDFASPYFAAIDLGSNSFHMIISRINQDTVETVDREKEMVQIAAGMRNNRLADDAQERALACLQRFAERLRDIPPTHIRAVGTKSVRSAKNAKKFLLEAEKTLGHPIAIISGYEEARLVYKGLSNCVASDERHRLVIDIGGASTEFIIGRDAEPELLESLNFGCVVYTERFQLREQVTESRMRQAYLAARTELELIRPNYMRHGWDAAYGTSGTMRAIADVLTPQDGGAMIRAESLSHLHQAIIKNRDEALQGLPKLRREVLPGGIAVLKAIFDGFNLQQIHVADATLKDGLLYDTIGRLGNSDARHSAVAKLQRQYHVDTQQAERVSQCAVRFWKQIDGPVLVGVSRTKVLDWAAKLHEVGLGISHSSHHNHSYYILRHSDLAGFGRYEQHLLAYLVRAHRKKLNHERLSDLEEQTRLGLIPMIICLRLAVILYRRREDLDIEPQLSGEGQRFSLSFPAGWLARNPLTLAGLEKEVAHFKNLDIQLGLTEDNSAHAH